MPQMRRTLLLPASGHRQRRLGLKKNYYPYGDYLREIFGQKVYKLSVDAGFSCPNRDGAISRDGCIFCDDSGSFAQTHSTALSVEEQVRTGIEILPARLKAQKFIAYFQAFSNTYKPVEELRKLYGAAFCDDRVVGISIGTRPDCLDEKKMELIAGLKFPQLEFGLQTIHDTTLKLINRGHDYKTFERAYKLAKSYGIKVCVHIILGLPAETRAMMMQTVETLADLRVDGVKFHVLTVLEGSKLAQIKPPPEIMNERDYCELVCDMLEILPPTTTIHRLAGSGLSSTTITPEWVKHKFHTLNLIDKILEERGSCQGARHKVI